MFIRNLALLALATAFTAAAFGATETKTHPKKLRLAPLSAAEKRKTGKDNDLLKSTTFHPDKVAPERGIKVNVTCTDSQGRMVKQDDPTYNSCLSDARRKQGPNGHGGTGGPTATFDLTK